jgi:hypothetical protein
MLALSFNQFAAYTVMVCREAHCKKKEPFVELIAPIIKEQIM